MAEFETITEKVLNDYLETVKQEIFLSQNQLGITASGFSENNTRITSGLSGRAFLSAPRYLTTNFDRVGRRAGGFAPIQPIKDWIAVKGIQLRDQKTGRFMSRDQGAFLIARKIGQQGTDIYSGKRPGIPIKRILKEQLPTAGRQLAKAYANEMINEVNKAIKR